MSIHFTELSDGDLVMGRAVRDNGTIDPDEAIVRYWDEHCPDGMGPGDDCPVECCRAFQFFGSDITVRPSKMVLCRRVRVVDAD